MTMIEDPADQPLADQPLADQPPPGQDRAERSTPTARPATTVRTGQPEASATGLVITPTHEAETVVLTLAGDLDIASVPLLERHLDDAAPTGSGRLVIDLSELEFLDSTGLRLLLTTRQRLQRGGQALCLRRARPAVQRLFELTQTVELFRFED